MTGETMDLQTLLADHQSGHSEFQCDYFISAKVCGTPYGMYKQALRELDSRVRALRELYITAALAELDVEELEEMVAETEEDRQRRRLSLDLLRKRSQLDDAERSIQTTEAEFLRFFGQAVALKQKLGDIDHERREVLDREMWQAKIKSRAAVELMTAGGLSASTVEILASAPGEWTQPIMQAVEDDLAARRTGKPSELFGWLFSNPAPVAIGEVPEISVRQLVLENEPELLRLTSTV